MVKQFKKKTVTPPFHIFFQKSKKIITSSTFQEHCAAEDQSKMPRRTMQEGGKNAPSLLDVLKEHDGMKFFIVQTGRDRFDEKRQKAVDDGLFVSVDDGDKMRSAFLKTATDAVKSAFRHIMSSSASGSVSIPPFLGQLVQGSVCMVSNASMDPSENENVETCFAEEAEEALSICMDELRAEFNLENRISSGFYGALMPGCSESDDDAFDDIYNLSDETYTVKVPGTVILLCIYSVAIRNAYAIF
jgi:hypothetical protein